MDQKAIETADTAELSLKELYAVTWQKKWLIGSIVILCTIAGICAGLLIAKQYRAEIVISPVSDSPTGIAGGLSGLASQYGELASLAGISMSGKGTKEEAVAVLSSELITEAYVRAENLLPVLYPKKWDARTKAWIPTDASKIPSLWKANQYFKKSIREVKQDKQTGLVTMRITWTNPTLAAKWANDLVRLTNQYLRDKAISESERNIAYLNEQAAKTSILEARTAIYAILKEEVNKQMLAKGREEYALKVIDPARAPEVPTSPGPLLLGALGLGIGVALSALLVWRRTASSSAHFV